MFIIGRTLTIILNHYGKSARLPGRGSFLFRHGCCTPYSLLLRSSFHGRRLAYLHQLETISNVSLSFPFLAMLRPFHLPGPRTPAKIASSQDDLTSRLLWLFAIHHHRGYNIAMTSSVRVTACSKVLRVTPFYCRLYSWPIYICIFRLTERPRKVRYTSICIAHNVRYH